MTKVLLVFAAFGLGGCVIDDDVPYARTMTEGCLRGCRCLVPTAHDDASWAEHRQCVQHCRPTMPR